MTVYKLPDFVFDEKIIGMAYIYNIDVVCGSSLFFESLGSFLKSVGEEVIQFKIEDQDLDSIKKSPLFISEPTLKFNIKSGYPDDLFKKTSYKYKRSESTNNYESITITFDDKVIHKTPPFDPNVNISKYTVFSIFSIHNQVEIYGSNKNWRFYFDRGTEWLIVGLSNELVPHFRNTFISNINCEKYRYKEFLHAINNNFALASAHSNNKIFIKKLEENYENKFLEN